MSVGPDAVPDRDHGGARAKDCASVPSARRWPSARIWPCRASTKFPSRSRNCCRPSADEKANAQLHHSSWTTKLCARHILLPWAARNSSKTLREQILKANDEIDEAIVPPDISMNVMASLYPRRTFCAIRQLRARATLPAKCGVRWTRHLAQVQTQIRSFRCTGSCFERIVALLIVMHIGDPI